MMHSNNNNNIECLECTDRVREVKDNVNEQLCTTFVHCSFKDW